MVQFYEKCSDSKPRENPSVIVQRRIKQHRTLAEKAFAAILATAIGLATLPICFITIPVAYKCILSENTPYRRYDTDDMSPETQAICSTIRASSYHA